jgi:hypothetical protein
MNDQMNSTPPPLEVHDLTVAYTSGPSCMALILRCRRAVW